MKVSMGIPRALRRIKTKGTRGSSSEFLCKKVFRGEAIWLKGSWGEDGICIAGRTQINKVLYWAQRQALLRKHRLSTNS